MPTAIQTAHWIVQYRSAEMDAPVDPMSLEKLVYYAQCFRLALTGTRLFEDEIRAWKLGPVVRSVYDEYRKHGAQPIQDPAGQVPELTGDIESHLRDVVAVFGGLNAFQLSDATHEEEPWLKAREGYSRRDPSDILIPSAAVQAYYSSLLYDGEDALSQHELLSVLEEPRWGAFYVAGICSKRIVRHPLYRISLAKKLAEPMPDEEQLPDDFYAPIGKPKYADLGDLSGLSSDEIVGRAFDTIRS